MTDEGSGFWYLLRAAVLAVGEPPQQFHFELRNGDTITRALQMVSLDGKPFGMLAVARVPIESAPVPGETLHVPESRRRQAESALEFVCRLVALEHGNDTQHHLATTVPRALLH